MKECFSTAVQKEAKSIALAIGELMNNSSEKNSAELALPLAEQLVFTIQCMGSVTNRHTKKMRVPRNTPLTRADNSRS
jgi:hypothetical protein